MASTVETSKKKFQLWNKVSSGFFIHYPGVFSQLFAIFHLFLATLDQIVLWNIISDDDDYY